jgi:integrase
VLWQGRWVKVRKIIYKSGKMAWQLDYGMLATATGMRRKQVYFSTRDEAVGAMAAEKARRRAHGDSAVSFPEDLRVRYAAAEERLVAAGGTIEKAVELWIKHARTVQKAMSLSELLERCCAAKRALGKSVKYIQTLRTSCLSFIRGRESQEAASVTRDEVEKWILGNGWQPKTQRGYLGDLRTLFSFGISMRPRCVAVNPAASSAREDRIPLAAMSAAEIRFLSAREVRRLLVVASAVPRGDRPRREDFREFVWYVALGCFCGVRPAELRRLTAADVDVMDRHVIVKAAVAKSRKRRVVDISANALEWLSRGPMGFSPLNFQRRWDRLRRAAGVRDWPSDAMRHTFASMHYAHFQNESLLKAQMGHSQDEDVLFQHYRGLVSRREAAAFWGLRPGRLIADCK